MAQSRSKAAKLIQVGPKSSQGCPKIERKSAQSRFEVRHKSTQRGAQSHLTVNPKICSKSGQSPAKVVPKVCSKTGPCLPGPGPAKSKRLCTPVTTGDRTLMEELSLLALCHIDVHQKSSEVRDGCLEFAWVFVPVGTKGLLPSLNH